jgi:DNA-binding HxlR family transcriptional regulator
VSRTSVADLPCSVARSLDVLGDTWTLLVLRDAMHGRRRFSEFLDSLPIARNVLTDRLGRLVNAGVLTRVRYQQRPPRYEYRLTDKGRDLVGPLLALLAWGDRWLTPAGEPVPADVVHTTCGHDTTAVVVCSVCNGPLRARQVRLRPNLGQSLPDRIASKTSTPDHTSPDPTEGPQG